MVAELHIHDRNYLYDIIIVYNECIPREQKPGVEGQPKGEDGNILSHFEGAVDLFEGENPAFV